MSFEASLNLVDFSDYPSPDPEFSFYISPDGSDSPSSTGSENNPFKTIGRAYQELSAHRSFTRKPDAYGYIVAKPGVYSIDTLGTPEFISPTIARGTAIFNIDGMKNVTIMSQFPLKAKVDSFSKFEQLGVYGVGTDHETAVLISPPELTYNVRSGSQDFSVHYFYGLFSDPRNVPPTFAMTTARSDELPRFSEDRIPYPAIYGYSATEDVSNWKSNFSHWTMNRTDTNKYNLGLDYITEQDSNGDSHFYIQAREDLLAAYQQGLPNPFGGDFSFIETFWNTITAISQEHPAIDWSLCSIAFRGGNSNIFETYVVGVDAVNKRIEVEELPTWSATEARFSVQGNLISGNGQATSSLALIGKDFANKPYMYAYDRFTGQLNYKVPSENPELPRSASGNNFRSSIHLKGSTNVTVAGFHFCGYDSCVLVITPYPNAESINTNFYFKYNACVDSNGSGAGIQVGNIAGDVEVVGNIIIRAARRAINYTRRPFSRTINDSVVYDITRDQFTPAKIHNNLCYDWREGAGLFSAGDKAVFSNNVLLVAAVAHGDGMALYDNSRDIVVRNNYIYTPGIIGIAINDIDPLSLPFVIEGNYIQSVTNRASGESVGLIFNNNVIASYSQSEFLVNLANNSDGLWWDAPSKTRFRNNVILKLGPALDYTNAQNPDGTFTTFTVGMPSEFAQTAANLASTMGRAHQYWSHSWLASDNLPNAHNNITPARYSFDDQSSPLGSDVPFYPYTETQTINANSILNPGSNFQVPAFAVSDADRLTLDGIYDSMFIDWRNGDLRLKEEFRTHTGNPIGMSISPGATFDYASQTGVENLDNNLHKWWKPSDAPSEGPNNPYVVPRIVSGPPVSVTT